MLPAMWTSDSTAYIAPMGSSIHYCVAEGSTMTALLFDCFRYDFTAVCMEVLNEIKRTTCRRTAHTTLHNGLGHTVGIVHHPMLDTTHEYRNVPGLKQLILSLAQVAILRTSTKPYHFLLHPNILSLGTNVGDVPDHRDA